MNEFITNIISAAHYKINDIREGVVPLTELQNRKAIDFLNALVDHQVSGNLEICLRGDNYENLSQKLFSNSERNNLMFDTEFYRRCFLLGDKAKNYYLCSYSHNNPVPWSLDIGKVNSEDFDFIFYEMTHLVRSHNFNWNNDNSGFIEYFSNNNNKPNFKQLTITLNPLDQLLIRDYYCWLLHTAANERFHSYSYYVSTTTDPEICENYSNDNGPVAILYFVPEPIHKLVTSFKTIKDANQLLHNIGLPTINSEVYPDEFEISIKGALFPHFIVGFYEYENNKFVFNHHLFKKDNRSVKSILTNGLDIDQTDFFDYIKRTSYQKGVGLFSDGQFTEVET